MQPVADAVLGISFMDLPRGRQTHPPWRPHFMRRRRTKEKPADCQGCRRARLCPVRGTHTKSASFKDSVAGLMLGYRLPVAVSCRLIPESQSRPLTKSAFLVRQVTIY